uniref:Uncharacterized protein n=1 Tax=Zea mays TaxID=4577 RepID=C4J067_MAIZE|nr:unknown [Zea mays]
MNPKKSKSHSDWRTPARIEGGTSSQAGCYKRKKGKSTDFGRTRRTALLSLLSIGISKTKLPQNNK